MENLADAYICLPGGVGTLEELAEVLTMQQLGHVTGPVGLVDTEDSGARSSICLPQCLRQASCSAALSTPWFSHPLPWLCWRDSKVG